MSGAEEASMTEPTGLTPRGTRGINGIASRRSQLAVADTVQRLTDAMEAAGAKVFAVIDHSGEAARVGMSLRDTKLIIFGNPRGGTPVMEVAPLAALELPLKILVWADDDGAVWMSYLSAEWLEDRYGLPPELARPLAAVDTLTSRLAP
jgi:uncharacterized protein (DUF302 family)